MKLHIFNPEHDIALAYNRRHQTMPHAAQELRMNLGWLPALWADDGDVVLVDDARFAVKAASRWKNNCREVLFLEKQDLRGMRVDKIQPWGWDLHVFTELQEAGVVCSGMPSEEEIGKIRQLSSRCHTASLLPILRGGLESETCGEAFFATSTEDIEQRLADYRKIVVKAPWSSSGRGVRFVDEAMDDAVRGWAERIIRQQGGVMVEPLYSKIRDFGMEFEAVSGGIIEYRGLSLFETRNQAYTGNILADEESKREMLSRYIGAELLDEVQHRLERELEHLIGNNYVGPLGVDMMVVSSQQPSTFLLHPCVEINLRRTMGHVALAFPTSPLLPMQLMSIIHDINYKLKTSNLENNYVQVL